LLVNFWATWCGPCLNEIPMLKTFQEEHPWLKVVGVAIDTDEAVQAFAEEMDFNYQILIGRTEGVSLATQLNVGLFAMPVTVFTDAGGRTLGAHFGALHPEHLENLVAVLEDLQAGRADLDEARARIAALM